MYAGFPTEGDPLGSERKTLAVLCTAVAFATVAIFGSFTLAAVIVLRITDSAAWVGAPTAVSFVGVGLASVGLSRRMARHGRKRGLVVGWVLGVVGGILAVVASVAASLPLLLAAMALIGVGYSASTLARYASAALVEPEQRAFAIGLVAWATAAGALSGPVLVAFAEDAASRLGLAPGVGGFTTATAGYTVAVLLAATLSRHAWPPPPPAHAEPPVPRPLHDERVRIALVALIANQAAMVLLMAVMPAHLVSLAAGLGLVGLVMSGHFAGMFAFGPVVGRVADRVGPAPSMIAGIALLAAGCAGAAFWSHVGPELLSLPLFAAGLGWSLSFVSASSVLTHGLPPRATVSVQGSVDAALWAVSAAASVLGGVLLADVGFTALASGAAVVLPLAGAWVFARRRVLAG